MLDIFLYAGRAIMPLLLMMALGCGLRRAGRWSDDFYRQLNGFCSVSYTHLRAHET